MKVFRYVMILVILILAICSFFFIYPNSSRRDQMQSQYDVTRRAWEAKNQEHNQLQKLSNDLKTNPDAVEKVAREKYHFSRDGETVIRFN